MSTTLDFEFGDLSVARGYDSVLAPVMFVPWAEDLAERHGPWQGQRVVDLATGTGAVAEQLARRVGPHGEVLGVDINEEMLALAKKRCKDIAVARFAVGPAAPLAAPDGWADTVVCQQAFQFFPDRVAVAREIRRVLKPGGRVIASVWHPVTECEVFGAICAALESIGETGLSTSMRVPFDHLPADELAVSFVDTGFECIRLRRRERELVLDRGPEHAVEFAYATPIGPGLRALPAGRQAAFRDALATEIAHLSPDGRSMGTLVATELTASRAG